MKEKTIDLSVCSAVELTAEESASVSGGNPWIPVLITYVVLSMVTNPQAHINAFVQGFKEGYSAMTAVK